MSHVGINLLCWIFEIFPYVLEGCVISKLRQKKINVLFPEMSEYFLGSVGREFFLFWKIFYIGKSMKTVQNTLKIEDKFSGVSKKFRVGPKKVGSVGFSETRNFFFFFFFSLALQCCVSAPSLYCVNEY